MLEGYTVMSPSRRLLPREDSFNVSGYAMAGEKINILAVADGITRDPPVPFSQKIPNITTRIGRALYGLSYLAYWFGDPAQKSADHFTKEFVAQIEAICPILGVNEERVFNGFRHANNTARDLIKNNIDFLLRDYPGCVASAAVISRDRVYYASIGDCGVAVFDKEGRIKDKTNHGGIVAEEHIDGFNFREPRWRAYWRTHFRNKPEAKSPRTGENFSFGAITGEPEAMHYVSPKSSSFDSGDFVLAYTDGAEEILLPVKGQEKTIQRRLSLVEDIIRRRDFSGLKQILQEEVKYEATIAFSLNE